MNTRSIALAHWDLANARDWHGFGLLLAPGLVYEAPQTRERIVGSAGYIDFFATWPGAWSAKVLKCIADERSAMTVIEFQSAEPPMTGLTLFEFEDGLISRATDYWPSPYEPGPRASRHVQRY
jgi:SnoaL-like domain